VTGAAGFIGSNLVHQLVLEGWSVTGVDDLSNGHVEFVEDLIRCDAPFSFLECDFSSDEALRDVKNGRYDVVFHLAAAPRVSYSVDHPLETNDNNVSKSLKLIDACRDNVERFVFSSSSSVYGGADMLPTPEAAPKRPKSPYALQKSIIEDYLVLYGELYGFESVSLRYFNVFGQNQLGDSPYSTAVSAWLAAIMNKKPMRSDGDGSQSRDMCHVDNVVLANMLAAEHQGPLKGDRLNIACGNRVTNLEVLQYLLERFPEAQKVNAPWRRGDVMHTHADVSKACSVLGYRPIVEFWGGLDATIEWYMNSPVAKQLSTMR
jgi:nucleoside-diphosphate-sugar epimerase